MVVKLHNRLLSSAHECTGCLRAKVQGAALFSIGRGGDEGWKGKKEVIFRDCEKIAPTYSSHPWQKK